VQGTFEWGRVSQFGIKDYSEFCGRHTIERGGGIEQGFEQTFKSYQKKSGSKYRPTPQKDNCGAGV